MDRLEKLLEFLRQNPKDSFVRHALAMEYVKLDRVAGAQQMLEALLNDSPDYIGSYYQLAKILERKGDTDGAIRWYEQGIRYARQTGTRHAMSELQSALDELMY